RSPSMLTTAQSPRSTTRTGWWVTCGIILVNAMTCPAASSVRRRRSATTSVASTRLISGPPLPRVRAVAAARSQSTKSAMRPPVPPPDPRGRPVAGPVHGSSRTRSTGGRGGRARVTRLFALGTTGSAGTAAAVEGGADEVERGRRVGGRVYLVDHDREREDP